MGAVRAVQGVRLPAVLTVLVVLLCVHPALLRVAQIVADAEPYVLAGAPVPVNLLVQETAATLAQETQ